MRSLSVFVFVFVFLLFKNKAEDKKRMPIERFISTGATTKPAFLLECLPGSEEEENFDTFAYGNLFPTLSSTIGPYSFVTSASPAGGIFLINSPLGSPGDQSASANLNTDTLVFDTFTGDATCIGAFIFATYLDETLAVG